MLQFMGSQSLRHDLATEQQQRREEMGEGEAKRGASCLFSDWG